MLISDAARQRMRSVIFVPANERRDNCGACTWSVAKINRTGGSKFRCQRLQIEVSAGGICAEWRPMGVSARSEKE